MSDAPEDESRQTPEQRLSGKLRGPGGALEAAGTLSGSVIGCLLIGWLIGDQTGSNPAAALIGLFTGIAVGLYNLAKQMLRR